MMLPSSRHFVKFKDGSGVWGTPFFVRSPEDPRPDFGLYLVEDWAPDWPHEFIDWPDLGVPTDDVDATRKIVAAYEFARSGRDVEVGCRYGMGRTGTVIACMAFLSGVPLDDAATWTKVNYRPEAVEGIAQRAWVTRFAEVVGT